MRQIFNLILIIICLASCNGKSTKDHFQSDCEKFNTQGVDSLMHYKVQFKKKKSTIESSLNLLNEAIKCDSNLNVARINKIPVLAELGQYNAQIEVINDLIKRTKDSTLLITRAGVYEKLNEQELSTGAYKAAYKYCVRVLKDNPQNSSIIYFKILTQSKIDGIDAVQSEIDYYLSRYPDDKNLRALLTDTITLRGSRKRDSGR
jgi:tetratricopeptide (TPR) repeat protein